MRKMNYSPLTVVRFPINAHFTIQTVGYIEYPSPWKHFPRCSSDYILYFIKSGDLYIEEEGIRWHAEANTALLLEPGKTHRGYQSAPVSYYYVHFTCSEILTSGVMTDTLREQIIQLHIKFLNSAWEYQWKPSPYDSADLYFPKNHRLGGSYSFFQSLEEMDRVFFEGFEGRRSIASLRLQELLTMMCREFSYSCINPNNTRTLILIRNIRLYIDRNYTSAITSQTISQEFHINYDYANRQFKHHTGQSIHDYLITTRIHRAKRLLTAGTTVSETACQVGIEDSAYFSRLFKKHTGKSPSEYVQHTSWER